MNKAWVKKFGLHTLSKPVFFTDSHSVGGMPYAATIKAGLDDVGLDAVFCVENKPVAAFLLEPSKDELLAAHSALWNQGVVSVLAVIHKTDCHLYSLHTSLADGQHSDTALIETLDIAADAMAAINFLASVESGRFFVENKALFQKAGRVDSVLLDNLLATEERLLDSGLDGEAARALLLQTVFISYLEDRGLVTSEFISSTIIEQNEAGYIQLLRDKNTEGINKLFSELHRRFNGNVFFSPCSFGETASSAPLTKQRLALLADFREGGINLKSGQQRFWPFDFRYIPVELISAIYDRLLAKSDARKGLGAFFTPHYLADFSVDQLLAQYPLPDNLTGLRVIDPACGSGVFLVSFYRSLVQHYKQQNNEVDWSALVSLAETLHGIDPQHAAVRLTVFSIYIAMVEEAGAGLVDEMEDYIPLFPPLFGKTIKPGNFFDEPTTKLFDYVIGNPPWASRTNAISSSVQWCKEHDYPQPQKEAAWAFIWKALEHIKGTGHIAFLLPATGVLHNLSKTLEAQKALFTRASVSHIYDFSDLAFQLFEGAKRPTLLAFMSNREPENQASQAVNYLCPKYSRRFNANVLVSENADRHQVPYALAEQGLVRWKEMLWASPNERKLLGWLKDLSTLGDLVVPYKSVYRLDETELANKWVMGQGYQPAIPEKLSDPAYPRSEYAPITTLPYLPATSFTEVAVVEDCLLSSREKSSTVRMKGFTYSFDKPKVVIPQGIKRDNPFLRAAFTDATFSFQHSLQAITFPIEEKERAKFLCAYLNSSFVAWYLFNTSANWGVDRAKVLAEEIPRLPFPTTGECRDANAAKQAIEEAAQIIDTLQNERELLEAENGLETLRARLDLCVYKFLGLTETEVKLIEDSVSNIVPSVQPRLNRVPAIRQVVSKAQITNYAETLSKQLSNWLENGSVAVTAYIGSQDVIITKLFHQADVQSSAVRTEVITDELLIKARQLQTQLGDKKGQLFGYVGEITAWVGNDLYLIKPNEVRHWLTSSALSDAGMIFESSIGA